MNSDFHRWRVEVEKRTGKDKSNETLIRFTAACVCVHACVRKYGEEENECSVGVSAMRQ